MARDRQRAKQRQAERRARRLAGQGGPDPAKDGGPRRAATPDGLVDPTAVEPSPAVDPGLAVGAPPEDQGRSDGLIAADQAEEEASAAPDAAGLSEEAISEIDEGSPGDGAGAAEQGYAPRGRRARPETAAQDRPRFVQFLFAVWAELQRVQWPNRQALTTLTGVVLGFVLIAGGYLGLLDAIFSRIIQAIL